MRGRALTALAALAATLAACGGSHHRTPATSTAPPAPGAQFLPTGLGTLARGKLPGGERFAIRSQNYRVSGTTYLQLSVTTGRGGGPGFTPAQLKGPLAFTDFGECAHPKALLVYGVLRVAADKVTVTARGAERQLARAPIPAGLHAGGILVYGETDTPAVLDVRGASGAVAARARVSGGSRLVCPGKAGTFTTLALLH